MGEATVFHCPQCGQAYSITAEQVTQYAGRMLACTRCSQRFVVPENIGQAAAYGVVSQGYGAAGAVTGSGLPPDAVEGGAKTSGMAVASLVCGLALCVPFVTGILAAIFGLIGLRDVREGKAEGKGMATAGVILGSANVLLWIILFAIGFAGAFPAIGNARERAMRVQCASNLRQIGTALAMYASDNNGRYPANFQQLSQYGVMPSTFVCPSTGNMPAPTMPGIAAPGRCSYTYIQPPLGRPPSADFVVAYEKLEDHQGQGMNVLCYDGHVEWVTGVPAQRMYSNLRSGRNPPGR